MDISIHETRSPDTSQQVDDKVPVPANESNESSIAFGTEKQSAEPVPEKAGKKRRWFSKSVKDTTKDEDEDDKPPPIKPVSLVSLFRFATRTELILQFFGLAIAAGAGAALPCMTLVFGQLVTLFTDFGTVARQIAQEGLTPATAAALEIAKRNLKKEVGNCALYLMAMGLGMFILTYTYMVIWNYTSEAQSKRLRESYLRAVLRQEIAWFDDMGAGEIASRIQTDCHLVQISISEKMGITVQHFSTFIAGFVVAYARNPRLAGILTTSFPVIILSGGIMGYYETKAQTKCLGYIAKAGSVVEEVVSSIRTVKAFASGPYLGKRFNAEIGASRDAGVNGAAPQSAGLGLMFFTVYAAYALAFAYGGRMVEQGAANSGEVINVVMAILIGAFSIAMVAPELQSISKGRAAATKLFETIDRDPTIDSADPGGLRPDKVVGDIAFENLVFHYPSRPNVPVLKGLSTVFGSGDTCALVGASGSGKSTVIQLLERFYDPVGGRITLDGIDIRELNLKWLRQQMGYVAQEPVLFATSLRGNVEHGLIGSRWENAPDAERLALVKKACEAANADSFISKLPDGYDTHVGERGMLLSGGQKQRVAIARAIVSDPRILLLDEATSALDGHSERVVQDALEKASVGRTTIVIAHRLATVKDADRIIVMGAGKIVEKGTHNSLLEDTDGAYYKLVQNQQLQQKAADKAADELDSESDGEDLNPLQRHISPELYRQHTHGNRSLASLALEQRRIDVTAYSAPYDKAGFFPLFWRLLRVNRKHWVWYIPGIIGAVAAGMVYPAMSILFGKTIADFELPRESIRPALDRKGLWFFIIALLSGIAMFFNYWSFSRTGWELASTLRTRLFTAVTRHDVEWFDEEEHATGTVTSDISDRPQKIQGLFGVTLGSILQAAITLFGGIIVGLCYGPLLSLIGIACIPLIIGSGYIRLRVVVLKEEKTKKWHAGSAQLASEAAASVRTVASLTREDDVEAIYARSLEEPMAISIRTAYGSQALFAASQGITFLVVGLVFYIGAIWIIDGKYDTETFFISLNAVIFAAIEAGDIFQFVPDASKANSAARSVFRILDNVPEVDADSDEGIKLDPASVQGAVAFHHVHFRYPSRPGVRVLRKLSLEIPAGKYVALVGPSGCGKSTTIQLIERFYDPQAGSVTLDGHDLRTLNVRDMRSHIALVSQEPTLYDGSVRFNVALGAVDPSSVTEEQVVSACKDANIYDFIMSLPDGFDTPVGGKGSQLSGGQKQRIAIARALVRNPKVLLLDEATAALDSTSERVVQAALDNAARGRTTVAIAHRLSTIQNADMIYFIQDGAVIERGTHDQLIARGGAYADLVQMQVLSRVH
ncbi:hypothetical protein CcaverHIS002_0510850 [Cutaneotrichosporon cavernicola]|uniref:P-loop containing nucleoside triphosphate hydrolase protein n=1 Tax=Cutaneotrichosporon cavernicola TaxID=279322 RepID=A0AA48L7N8_9TREE|nr:uncharacterized protein CcaverHIS019_0511420 [Cutaneotrichosporon cavernicola]BEI85684.1 hypothetical protein CcaverHIS002_0510850 [Cutaneotrichosporon cavernicola]BEI93514.1 hypothetical protein CcaverHIS019_0511420 [Cutaneotrichosporon cavernicola]